MKSNEELNKKIVLLEGTIKIQQENIDALQKNIKNPLNQEQEILLNQKAQTIKDLEDSVCSTI